MTLNTPQYTIRVRDASLNPQGALSAWTAGDVVLRMNDVGKWALTVRADDPLRSVFATRGAGIIVTRDRGDGSGAQTIMSGPIWAIDRKGRDNFYTLGGPTDEWWLKARRALPAGGRPYMEQALILNPLRYHRLGSLDNGTTAVDSSGNGQNGTYVNGPTLGVAGSIPGDPDTAVTFVAASSQRVGLPSGSNLPTGNAPWTLVGACKFGANPAALAHLVTFGQAAIHQMGTIYIDTSGIAHAGTFNGDTTGGVALSLNTWHLIVGVWDGTTIKCFVDGAAYGTNATPGAMTIAASPAAIIGARVDATTQFFNGQLDEIAIHAGALTPAQITALYNAWSRTHGAYDARTGQASGVLLGYVAANLTAPVDTDRAMTFMTAAADPAVGTTVSGNARWDELLALLQQLASSGGDIGFRVVQTANGALTFSVYQPNDKTAAAKFSQDLQNLYDYSYSLAGPQANAVEVLGGGTGAGRAALRMADATSIANWGLVEGVKDARDTSDVPTMQQRGQADVNALSEQTNLALTPRDTDAVQYGRDYNLGDIVAVTIDGNTIINKIRSVHIELKTPDQELVTPGIGNPTQGEVARWFDAYAARQQALVQVQSALNRLSAAQ